MIFIAVKYEMLFNSCELTFVFLAGKFFTQRQLNSQV